MHREVDDVEHMTWNNDVDVNQWTPAVNPGVVHFGTMQRVFDYCSSLAVSNWPLRAVLTV